MATQTSYHKAQLLIDEEITELTAQWTQLQESIRRLKTRRNELAPVYKLPDEVLQHIFLIFRDLSDQHPKNWQQVTHICRDWRHAAVGSPSLWTLLLDPPNALVPLMLERSKSAPLAVRLLTLSNISIVTLTAILHNIERIRTLILHFMPSDYLDTFHNIFASLG
ncbi:hypothetical protein D9619_010031 [Psilocybe cf. subviscida]|uniref:F-box domain-containing protein n=1 Tax=Psilocybe cf. subviscida TaxID=2480587 RepID=A0A8H5F6B5_9AGAR|nr:hypothetical protein D9619_010031 [Psilocybe cf. subviscida]